MQTNHGTQDAPTDDLGLDLPPGGAHYRAYVGPPADYDLVSAMAFNLLTHLGLRQHHRVLDIGCGSLRIGRLLIPYLNRGGYTGIDPNRWLIDDGIAREVGESQVSIKSPRFVVADSARSLVDEGARFEFLLAQSIFSHTGPDLFARWLGEAAKLLTDDGALVATYLPDASDTTASGWVYPDCVGYTRARVDALAKEAGLHTVSLGWHHPRQSWLLFVRDPDAFAGLDGQELSWNRCFERLDSRRMTG